jgi:hypothetical protein
MHRKEILETALQYVTQDRNVQNGEPEDNFTKIASYWNVHLDNRGLLKDFALITPEDVGILMVLFKVARTLASPTPDNYIDMAGYAACAGGIALGGKGDSYPFADETPKPPSSGGAAREAPPKREGPGVNGISVGDWVEASLGRRGIVRQTFAEECVIELDEGSTYEGGWHGGGRQLSPIKKHSHVFYGSIVKHHAQGEPV